ncbi:hypothetical protein Tco_0360353 [Tanacetum coccineum]
MTAERAAAVNRMWRKVLREKGLPTEGTAVSEADSMWKEILKEKGLSLDQVYELIDKDIVPLKVLSRRESDEWVGQQRSILGDDGYEEMMNNKFKTYEKYMMAVDVMDKMMLKKKVGKEKEVKKIAEDQEGSVLNPCSNKKKNMEKKKNKRKHHGEDDDNHNKKK